MSFVGKAVKKVFKTAGKVVSKVGSVAKKVWGNKWGRLAIIIGLSVFTAGLASGGFAAFGASMSAASAGGASGIGAFFSAVGTTMATGYGAITASVGGLFGGGAAAVPGGAGVFSAASQAGALAGTAGTTLAGSTVAAGVTSSALTGGVGSILGGSALAGGGAAAAGAAGGGLASSIISGLMSPTIGGTFARTAIIGGIGAYMQKKQYDEERGYKNNATVYGGKAFGGSAELPADYIKKALPGKNDPNKSTAQNLAISGADQIDPRASAQLLDPRTSNRPVRPGAERRRGATEIKGLDGLGLLNQPRVGALV